MPVSVVTDTTGYLPRELVDRYGITEVPLYVVFADRTVKETEITDYPAFFEELRRADSLPKTSQPSVGDFIEAFEPLLARGDEIVDAANRARAELKMWFAIGTLEFLKRGGRIGAASAWIGSTLKIKPILTVERELSPIERVRTSSRMFERLIDYAQQRHDSGADAWVVQHIAAPEQAEKLAERCREVFGREPLYVSEVGPVLSAHTGPGMLGVGSVPTHFFD